MLGSSVNFGQYSGHRQAAYDRLAQARQAKLDAEVQAAREEADRKARTGTDAQQLGALAVQGGLAYATGGASLAYAPLIDKASWTAMGKPQAAGTGISGTASTLGQVGYGLASANKAEALNTANKRHEDLMARKEQRFNTIAKYDPKQAMAMIPEMDAMDKAHRADVKSFTEGSKTGTGFLTNLRQRGKVDSSYVKGQAQKADLQQYSDQVAGPEDPNIEAQIASIQDTGLMSGPESPGIEAQIASDKKAQAAIDSGADPLLKAGDGSDERRFPPSLYKEGDREIFNGRHFIRQDGGWVPDTLIEESKKFKGDSASNYRFEYR